jgi:hypothetical protein
VRTGCRGIVTTNFDNCLESASVLEGRGLPLQDLSQAMASDKFFVLKPHGSISVPRTMVLSRSDWKRVEADRTFKDFIAQCVSLNQFVFLGYSMRDPDFNQMWAQILRERIFRSLEVYCCSKGSLRPEQHQELRETKVAVVEFPDDGTFAFIPSILTALIDRTGPAWIQEDSSAAKTERLAKELERYVLLSLHFSPAQENRLVLVAKALILEFLAVAAPDLTESDSLLSHVTNALGQNSPIIREAANLSIEELVAAKFIKREGASLRVEKDKLKTLNEQAMKLDQAQTDWVDRTLVEVGDEPAAVIETDDRTHVGQLVERVLMESGRQVAELFLFNRPPRDESEKIEQTVEDFCYERDLGDKRALYKRAIKRMMFEPGEADEDILFKKLQSYFISSAYVLDPTSEKLLSEYARDHWVYFDSSVILPALAVGHASHQVYKQLLSRSQALGMRLRVIRDMVNEVWANIRAAQTAFKEFSRASVSIQDVLEGYIEMHGAGNGNVFLEGFLNRVRLDPKLTATAYMSEVLGASNPDVGEEQVVRAISDSLGH